jgi:hypothetical protein|tara:strand:+ start:50 stop:826 length:777 start_codon:yes stop_codon:yes gene_type:complete
MKSKFSIVTVKPNLAALTTAFTATDLLFDWTPIEIPRGGCSIETIQMHYAGTNGVAQTPKDIELIFAKSVNGAAPPSLGTSNGAITSSVATQLARPHIIGYKHLDVSAMVDTGVDLVAYNLLGSFSANPNVKMNMILEGESAGYHSTKGPGYQTVWMAGIANEGGEDFGTGVIVDNGDGYGVGDAGLICDGTAGDIVFAAGDELIAQDGALVGTVVGSADDGSHTFLVLEAPGLLAAVEDGDEICNRQPITFIFGLEY